MKQLVLSTGFVLAASVVTAQDLNFTATQPCSSVEAIFEIIYNKYNETLLFTGNGLQISANSGNPLRGHSMFFVNQESGTWSHIMVYEDRTACMIGNGDNFEPYSD